MARENVEIARAVAAAYNRGDLDALMDAYHPEVEFVTLMLGTHRGKDAIRWLFEENRENLPGYSLDLDEVIDAGPDKVIAVTRMGGSGRASGIGLGDRIAFLATIRDELIVRQQTFRNKEDALEAAGMRE
jgi:ketosteroid isomerase-like protein